MTAVIRYHKLNLHLSRAIMDFSPEEIYPFETGWMGKDNSYIKNDPFYNL